jgi:GT2 family glycosyltransferase
MDERIALIMASFGRNGLLATTLKTLTETTDRNLVDVTVVDNGSGRETVNTLMGYRDVISGLVLLNENMGKPYAWNLGARMAAERCVKLDVKKPDYFLFCDNDLKFLPGWPRALLTTYREHEHLNEKPLCGLSGLSWPKHQATVETGPTTSINVYRFPPGCCVLMSAAAFEANGDWNTKRLIRTVDTSYFRNALRRGYRNASVHPDSVIEHTGRKQRSWDKRTGAPKLFT